jgi:hypothetical protein
MLKLKIMLTFLLFSLVHVKSYGQTENKDVTITASGSGATQEDAEQAALRSAIEQAYGAFISTKTEMLNDQVVADQMASVSSGNIKSYEVLNRDQLPYGRWVVTLKTLVSVDKLTSFVQAKGIAIEVKGGMFALNIKQQLLNEQGEIKAIAEMVGLLHEPMQISFDYIIKSGDPKSIDAESKNWEIPLVVTATCNKNIDFCANYFIKTLTALSLTPAEVETYKSLNKQVYLLSVEYLNTKINFYLRKQTSINAINSLLSNWDFYTRLFAVKSVMDESFGNGEGSHHKITAAVGPNNSKIVAFPTSGALAATFTWNDKRTLSQIEELTGYTVMPRGVISNFKNGGYVVYEEDGHGLVAAIFDFGFLNWDDAKAACRELFCNGYSDWDLPTIGELELLSSNLHQKGIGGFSLAKSKYWSSTGGAYSAWCFDFSSRSSVEVPKEYKTCLRAVRTF